MTIRKLLTGAVAVLAAAALTSVAVAAERPDDRAGPLGVGGVALTTPAQAVRPDDRAGLLGVGAIALATQPVRPDDRAGARGVGALPTDTSAPFMSVGTADTVQARIEMGLDGYGSPIAEPADAGLVNWENPFVVAATVSLAVILGGAAMIAVAEAIRHTGGGPGKPAVTH